MKILEVIPVFSDSFGGPVTVVRSIAEELAKKHQVVIYTTTALDQRHDSKPRMEQKNGYTIIYFERTLKPLCHSGLFGLLNTSSGMQRAVKNNLPDFDVVHVHSWQQFPDILIHYYATKYKIPYILQVHGSIEKIGKKTLKQIADTTFGYNELKDASKVIAINQLESQQYQSMRVPKNKISIVPNGINLSEFANLPKKGLFRFRFGINEKDKIILFLGRIHKIKGIDVLARAFVKVSAATENVKLVIAGPDDGYLKELKVLVNNLNLKNTILFVGPLYGETKFEAYVDSSVVVLPSRYEIWGMTVLEAVACGTPVILSNNCALADYIKGNVGLIANLDPDALAQALLAIMDPNMQTTFRKNCAGFIKQFDTSTVVSKVEKVYKEVVR